MSETPDASKTWYENFTSSTGQVDCQFHSLKLPEYSDWHCELFGGGPMGIVFRPLKGKHPNRFWRWMQFLVFGNKWVRN